MWLIVSSPSSHNLHLLFCCVLFILASIWLVLMALFCVAIWRGSVSLLRFPFLTTVQVFSSQNSPVCCQKYPYSCFFPSYYFTHLRVFHWSLSDCKFPQVSRTLLSILADLNNAVVWIVSSRPLISKSPSPCTNPLVTVPNALIRIGITDTFIFLNFSILWQGPGIYLSFRLSSVFPCGQPKRQSPLFGRFSFFYWLSLGLVIWPRLDDLLISLYYYYYYYLMFYNVID